jgi:putative nucleotidyltransferase-like protein
MNGPVPSRDATFTDRAFLEMPVRDTSELVAKVLAGSWRMSPPRLELSLSELTAATPRLLETGAGGLGWWRTRDSELADSQAGLDLHQAYRLNSLHAARVIRNTIDVLALLRQNSIEPILIKGPALAILYPESGLRPGGDIDLCVAPSDYRRADNLLKRECVGYNVDLHSGLLNLDHHRWDDLYARSNTLILDGTSVRVPCPEDHLRVLCFHFLREGAWRPLWLCDIANLVESRTEEFDWQLFLGDNAKRAGWFACAILLTGRLLEARLDDLPSSVTTVRFPSWFVGAVLKAWKVRAMQRRHLTPMSSAWRTPTFALKGLRYHWPNPIEGTIGVRGPFNELPRLPFQIGNCFVRTVDYLRRSRWPGHNHCLAPGGKN